MSSGEDIADLVPSDVRHVHLAGNPVIGVMRNAGSGHAQGELIANFDDDDFSSPIRLEDQVQRLLSSHACLTGYHSMRFTDGQRWWKYAGVSNYALGTSLLYRRSWWQAHRFPELQVGEDNDFVRAAAQALQLSSADAGELMFATTHPGNTSPRNLAGKSWQIL